MAVRYFTLELARLSQKSTRLKPPGIISKAVAASHAPVLSKGMYENKVRLKDLDVCVQIDIGFLPCAFVRRFIAGPDSWLSMSPRSEQKRGRGFLPESWPATYGDGFW
jgi:hypothetical protein